MIHKDIRITFKVKGRRYEAVGFLNDGEPSVDGETMLSRTAGENGGAIGKEDVAFLLEHPSKFPKKLQKYYLATGKRDPAGPHGVSGFCGNDRRCSRSWRSLDFLWYDRDLVLRRCA